MRDRQKIKELAQKQRELASEQEALANKIYHGHPSERETIFYAFLSAALVFFSAGKLFKKVNCVVEAIKCFTEAEENFTRAQSYIGRKKYKATWAEKSLINKKLKELKSSAQI